MNLNAKTWVGLAAGAAAYLVVRPLLIHVWARLPILEFPAAFAAVGILAAFARPRLAQPRATFVEPRRHEQVVRETPDPERAAASFALARWERDGAEPAAAADALARAMTPDADERARLRQELVVSLQRATGPASRASILRELSEKIGE